MKLSWARQDAIEVFCAKPIKHIHERMRLHLGPPLMQRNATGARVFNERETHTLFSHLLLIAKHSCTRYSCILLLWVVFKIKEGRQDGKFASSEKRLASHSISIWQTFPAKQIIFIIAFSASMCPSPSCHIVSMDFTPTHRVIRCICAFVRIGESFAWYDESTCMVWLFVKYKVQNTTLT